MDTKSNIVKALALVAALASINSSVFAAEQDNEVQDIVKKIFESSARPEFAGPHCRGGHEPSSK